jgi:hypothetical protein
VLAHWSRCFPLRQPARMCGDVALGALLEGHRFGGFELRLQAGRVAFFDRVFAFIPQLAAAPRSLACLGQAVGVERA